MKKNLILLTILFTSIISINVLRVSIENKTNDADNKFGGYSEEKPSDERSEKIFSLVKEAFYTKLHLQSNAEVKIHRYSTKIVAGIFYKLDLSVDKDNYTLVIFAPLPYTGKKPKIEAIDKL